MNTVNFHSALLSRIQEGELVLKQCSRLQNISGIGKLKNKIKAEILFLRKLQDNKANLKQEHFKCSNLIHLKAVVDVACELHDVVAVLKPFNDKENHRVVVDVIANNSQTWVKVIARNARALQQIYSGQGQYGEKSVLDHAQNYLQCAQVNLHYFSPPCVQFIFFNDLPEELCRSLKEMGVSVVNKNALNTSLEIAECGASSENASKSGMAHVLQEFNLSEGRSDQSPKSLKFENMSAYLSPSLKLNLDVTTMLAYVSSLTNGNCWYRFKEPVLNYQAEQERKAHLKPVLEDLFTGRELVCCQTAERDFKNIVYTLGGVSEKERAKQLLRRVHIVPDLMSDRILNLQLSSQIKERSRIIFGTGDHIKAATVTANIGFVRSAESQGSKLAVFVHESRALTEAKEETASPIE